MTVPDGSLSQADVPSKPWHLRHRADGGVVDEAAVLEIGDRGDLAGHAHAGIVVVGLERRVLVPDRAAGGGLVGGEDVGGGAA